MQNSILKEERQERDGRVLLGQILVSIQRTVIGKRVGHVSESATPSKLVRTSESDAI
jgi:hypothetical protein